MNASIKNAPLLKKILWLDTLLGGLTAVLGLLFFTPLATLLGLPTTLILIISIITLLYAVVALRLATQKRTSVYLLHLLIRANWLWTAVSVVLFFMYFGRATSLGALFLLLQILVVGGLAYWEQEQLADQANAI